MVLLKEDGSLDIERINKLPIEEYMAQIGDLTKEQREEYYSKSTINESNGPVHSVVVNYTMEEDIENNGSILFEEKIKELQKDLATIYF